MSFLALLSAAPGAIFFLGTWRSLPFILNIFLSLLTGIIVLFLFRRKEASPGVSLFLVEERLSLAVIATWFLWGGGIFIFIFLIIKRALAPFHLWLISALSSCRREALVWAISIHKAPVTIFFIRFKIMSAIPLLIFRLVRGAFFLLRAGETRRMVVLSSRNVFSSLFLFLWFLRGEGILFFLCYCFILWRILLRQRARLDRIFFFIGLIGVPPLLLFQIKWMVLYPLFQEAWAPVFLFILGSALATVGYIRYCFLIDLRNIKPGHTYLIRWGLIRGALLLI